jgi:hypothetical protein
VSKPAARASSSAVPSARGRPLTPLAKPPGGIRAVGPRATLPAREVRADVDVRSSLERLLIALGVVERERRPGLELHAIRDSHPQGDVSGPLVGASDAKDRRREPKRREVGADLAFDHPGRQGERTVDDGLRIVLARERPDQACAARLGPRRARRRRE